MNWWILQCANWKQEEVENLSLLLNFCMDVGMEYWPTNQKYARFSKREGAFNVWLKAENLYYVFTLKTHLFPTTEIFLIQFNSELPWITIWKLQADQQRSGWNALGFHLRTLEAEKVLIHEASLTCFSSGHGVEVVPTSTVGIYSLSFLRLL